MSYITVDEFKAYPLPITATQWQKMGDDQLELIIGYATEHLDDYMDRHLDIRNYVDRRRGSDLPTLLLENYPVVTINAVSSYLPNDVATTQNVNLFTHGVGVIEWLDRTRYKFYRNQTYIIDYDAGYAVIPGPVKHATALQTLKMLQPLFRGGAQFAEVELITDIDENVVEMLEKYRRKRLS